MTDEHNEESLFDIEVPLLEYKYSYIAFMDVLGFKEIARQSSTETVSRYFDLIEDSIKKLSEAISEFGSVNSQIMSDSIVLGISPKTKNTREKIIALRALCAAVSQLQWHLAIEGLWIRGAISYGEIYFQQGRFVVGPALVSAVELEQIAKYPRVVVEPKILQDLNLNFQQFLELMSTPDTDVSWVFDPGGIANAERFTDLIFINFGVNMLAPFKYSEEAAVKIARHLKAGLYGSPMHLEKYRWIRDYLLHVPFPEALRKHFLEI